MLTRKDFTELARALACISNQCERYECSAAIAAMCENSNPRFNRDRFYSAIEEMRKANA